MRDRLDSVFGLSDADVWAATGVIAAITLSLAVIAAASGSRLAQSFKSWESNPDAQEQVRVERFLASGLMAMQAFSFFIIVLTTVFALVYHALLAAIVLALLAVIVLVELFRCAHDVSDDRGFSDQEDHTRYQNRITQLRALPDDEPTAFVSWSMLLVLSMLCLSSTFFGLTEEELLLSATLTLAPLVLQCLSSVFIRFGLSFVGGLSTVLTGTGYVLFALSATLLLAIGALPWRAHSTPELWATGFVASAGLVCVVLLRLLGLRGRGPFRSFARSSLEDLEQTYDETTERIAQRVLAGASGC